MSWTLQIDEHSVEDVADAGMLRQRLLELHEQAKAAPLFAVLNAAGGSSLAIGLGRELSVLSYTAPGGWPAKHVHGDEANNGLIGYDYFGHFSEMPARYAIPVLEALDAVLEFFSSSCLTETLQWEDD
jgi:hypothetical protein